MYFLQVGKSSISAKLCEKDFASKLISEHAKNNHKCKPTTDAIGHIISADSVQVYRGVQVGANKPTKEEREATPHHLIDIVDSKSVCQYNAADWMRDTMQVLERLTNSNTDSDDEDLLDEESKQRKKIIEEFLSDNKEEELEILPVIVGGTMMYLQWLVHGRPDAMKPTEEALKKAASIVSEFEEKDEDVGWKEAVEYTSSLGPLFAKRVEKLPGRDWYRLRRTLEVAYTVLDDEDKEEKIKQLFSGARQGGLEENSMYDVRCFFLCPDDRMNHTAIVDSRCEEMLANGLLKETTDLYLSGELPDGSQQARAIGYRQTLDYLQRDGFKEKDDEAFGEYLDEFTTATRRYAKKQMQWFRKDDQFIFVPVPLLETSEARKEIVADKIREMCTLPRNEFENELQPLPPLDPKKKRRSNDEIDDLSLPISVKTRLANEIQGKNMKFYQSRRHKLEIGSEEYTKVLEEADVCTQKMMQRC